MKFALAVERNFLVGRNGGDDFGLIFFADGFEKFHRVVALPFFAADIFIARDDFFHALLR